MGVCVAIHPVVGEAAMSAKRRSQKKPRRSRSLVEILREFLTPALWKQVHQARRQTKKKESSRWMALPLVVLRTLAAGVRAVLARRLGDHWCVGGFIPMGCDGSRLECPRTTELEERLGQAGKAKSAPTLWVTALVHLRWGVPWAWRFGKGT